MTDRIIPNAKLDRIERGIHYANTRATHDSARLSGFRYDHGNISVKDDKGGETLLFLSDGDAMKYHAAHLICHVDPATLAELVTGYRMAKKAGLLDQKRTNRLMDELKKHPDTAPEPTHD